jgi:RecB family exonuclease
MDDLLRIYHDAWIPVGYTGQAHMEAMKKEGERELDAFYHSFHQDEPLPVVVEQPFAFHITPQLKIGGVIDRINRLSDGKIEIVDYKTATDVPTQKEVDKDSQLTVYALAATMAQDPRIASTPEEINLTLYYLGKGEKRTTTRTKEQLEKATEEIINLAKKIEVSDFQCSGIVWCKTCEYKMLCNVEH